MRLVDLYTCPWRIDILWSLLEERSPSESISHLAMPTLAEHAAFVDSHPYAAWYLAMVDDGARELNVGAIYLSRQREVGVAIFRRDRGRGHGKAAIAELIHLHPGRLLANINPANEASLALFRKLGFTGPIQVTLERRA